MKSQIIILHSILDTIKCNKYYLSLIIRYKNNKIIFTDDGEIHFHFFQYYDKYKPFQIKKIQSICKKYNCEYDFANKELIKKIDNNSNLLKFAVDIKNFLICQSKIYEFIFDDKTEKRYYEN